MSENTVDTESALREAFTNLSMNEIEILNGLLKKVGEDRIAFSDAMYRISGW